MFKKLINNLRKNNELNIELFKILGIGGVGIRRKEDDSFTERLDEIADLLDKMEIDRALELTFKK